MDVIKIRELFSHEPLNLNTSMMCMRMGIIPENLRREGVTVSFKIPTKLFASANDNIEANREAYEQIIEHRDLYTFISVHCARDLEEFKNLPYGHKCIWVKIGDAMACGHNRLIVTSGEAPNDKEAYYRATSYADFWDVVKRLTDMYEHPEGEYEPITLKQNNGYCGAAYKQWELKVN